MRGEKRQMQISVLVVDDEANVRDSVSKMIVRMGYSCKTAQDGKDAFDHLQTESFDVVISDIVMPRIDGMQLLRDIKSSEKDVDVIMMTAYGMEYSYMDVIDAGATDFIVKPFHGDELHAKIKRIQNERNLRNELFNLSIRDSLTGLFNRRYFFQKIQEEVERAKRQKRNLALVVLDVDRFKEYNDTHGHLEGDQVLAMLGQILKSSIRQNVDSACRYGGDEFAILLIETDVKQVHSIADRIRRSFENRDVDGCTLSLGVTQLLPEDEVETLIRRGDEAMYKAKRTGGNRVIGA
jgi:diguanylate cyclase (GGDEF)-like protein